MPDDASAVTRTLPVPSGLDWQIAVADTLIESGVSVAAFVPDARLHGILERLECHGTPLRSLTREEECVAYAAGQRIAGKRPIVLMQTSGLGNCLNPIATAAVPYRLGIPMVISIRGTLGERNPSQTTIGRASATLLRAVGVQCFTLQRAEDARKLMAGVCQLAYEARECAALFLGPELGAGRETH
jgi:sulfopyruvate decarboxylase alpha subunit